MGRPALTTKQFILKAQAAHGGSYDYELAIYTRSANKLLVKCAKHGAFPVRADKHLLGQGCPVCSASQSTTGKRKGGLPTWTTELFISECRKANRDRLDFSNTNYIGWLTKVNVSCPTHGPLLMWPSTLVKGGHCRYCVAIEKSMVRPVSKQGMRPTKYNREGGQVAFIEKASSIHNGKYLYGLLPDSINIRSKINIICPQHGPFFQNAASHLNGCGCPACNLTGWGKEKWVMRAKGNTPQLYIIEMQGEDELFYKVGITFRKIEKRFKEIEAYAVRHVCSFTNSSAAEVWQTERDIKNRKDLSRHRPDFFFPGHSECYKSLEELFAVLAATSLQRMN